VRHRYIVSHEVTIRAIGLQDSDAASNDLQDLVTMSDSLYHTDNNRQTAHGNGDGVHEESVITCLVINNRLDTSK